MHARAHICMFASAYSSPRVASRLRWSALDKELGSVPVWLAVPAVARRLAHLGRVPVPFQGCCQVALASSHLSGAGGRGHYRDFPRSSFEVTRQ